MKLKAHLLRHGQEQLLQVQRFQVDGLPGLCLLEVADLGEARLPLHDAAHARAKPQLRKQRQSCNQKLNSNQRLLQRSASSPA